MIIPPKQVESKNNYNTGKTNDIENNNTRKSEFRGVREMIPVVHFNTHFKERPTLAPPGGRQDKTMLRCSPRGFMPYSPDEEGRGRTPVTWEAPRLSQGTAATGTGTR